MEEENTTNTTTETILSPEPITVVVLLIVEIPAIACTLLILIYFASHWRQMIVKALHHHAILLLTIMSFLYITFDLPFSISHYRYGYDYLNSPSFCLWWYWIDYTVLCVCLFLTAIASLQRHILIFYSQWLHIKRIRWLLHYIPLIISIIYPSCFYLGFIYIYPCETLFDQMSPICPSPCYADDNVLDNIDWIFNTIFPVIVIIVANVTLVIRVIYSMKHIRQTQGHIWKRQKKLSLQLFAFTSLYVIVWTPSTLISLLQLLIFPNLFENFPELNYIYYMIYFVCPIQVFIYIFALPELMKSIKTTIIRRMRRTTTVIPVLPVH